MCHATFFSLLVHKKLSFEAENVLVQELLFFLPRPSAFVGLCACAALLGAPHSVI